MANTVTSLIQSLYIILDNGKLQHNHCPVIYDDPLPAKAEADNSVELLV